MSCSLRRGLEAVGAGAKPGQAAWRKALPHLEPVSGKLRHRGVHGHWLVRQL